MAVSGVKEIERTLAKLASDGLDKAEKKALGKGVRVIAKGQKDKVPGRYKHTKRLIGSSVKKARRGANVGKYEAKAGFGVGKKRTRLDKATGKRVASKLTESRKGRNKKGRKAKGVGLSLNNIHWAVLGTKDRAHKSGHKTGKMTRLLDRVVPEGTQAAIPGALSAIGASLKTDIEATR